MLNYKRNSNKSTEKQWSYYKRSKPSDERPASNSSRLSLKKLKQIALRTWKGYLVESPISPSSDVTENTPMN